MRKTKSSSFMPTSVMVWSIYDPVIENSELLEYQFNDLLSKGFDGLAVWVRCSRYTWDHPAAMDALQHISKLCKKNDIAYWFGPDPRFISRKLVGENNGLQIILYGDCVLSTKVPNFAPLINDSFNVRCSIPPRHTHMLHEVAIQFYPVGVLKAYAIRNSKEQIEESDCIDITNKAHFFYHAKDHYIEAFGKFKPPDNKLWQVVVFFLVKSSHVDFSSTSQYKRYLERLQVLAENVKSVDMIMFDEPGYTCVYGALPFSSVIQNHFLKKTGLKLSENLWKFATSCSDNSHKNVRINYFKTVQETMISFQKKTNNAAKRLWAKNILFGIHDSWHFESADMADMNHGSMDMWKSLRTKSGGFVDLGAINMLRNPNSDYYANLAAMSVICKSLGKFSNEKFCYNNLWTIGDDNGEEWQSSVMNHCVNVLALLGQRWNPHAYGPVGTVGEENTFLGSPPLPGYPNHSTWKDYPKWNRRLEEHFLAIDDQLPWANILLIYPVEYLYSLADKRATECAKHIFQILLTLLDNHFHVDVISPELLIKGVWKNGSFCLNNNDYKIIIYPYPQSLDKKYLKILNSDIKNIFCVFEKTSSIKIQSYNIKAEIKNLIEMLKQKDLRPVGAPENCWISLTKLVKQVVISIAPSRHNFEYEGEISYNKKSIDLSKSSYLKRLYFEKNNL